MLSTMLLAGALAASPSSNIEKTPQLEIHDRVESSAAVAAQVRLAPLAGRLSIQEGSDAGSWTPADGKSAAAWRSRHRFELAYDAPSRRLSLRVFGGEKPSVIEERILDAALARSGLNFMRLEVANFDANASARLDALELVQDGQARPLRAFGRGTMFSDLATIWAPELADGFVLRGAVHVDGAVRPSNARVWIDFGLGHGRRVAVDVDGYGWVSSHPAGLSASPGSKHVVGIFAAGQPVRLVADPDPALPRAFRGWVDGSRSVSATPSFDITSHASEVTVQAQFASAPAAPAQAGMPPATRGNGGSFTFDNGAAITIPAGAPGTTSGVASPYPATISVSGPIGGAVTDVTVKLENITHTHPDDLDILVVSPSGLAVLVMSDACGSTDIANFDWTFDDTAAASMPDSTICNAFFYRPTNHGDGDTFPAPAPTTAGDAMSDLDRENPNGVWRLYVVDDAGGDVGVVNAGWAIQIETAPYEILIPGEGSSGIADPYPSVRVVNETATLFGAILDLDVTLVDMTHEHGDDLDVLVVGPSGSTSILMSDACGAADFRNYLWTFDDEALAPMSDSTIDGCNPFNVQPTNYGDGDTWPAPAPAGNHVASLANLDGTVGTGLWALFVNDDAGGDVGFLEADWYVELTLDGIFRNGLEP